MTALNEVAEWSKEARDEDSSRYFYHFSDINAIEFGRKNYIIGRKGAGKTAIAEYIHSKSDSENHARILSFKNFPFNILYEEKDSDFPLINQYITIWEYVIYGSICNMMLKNDKINYDARSKLSQIYDVDLENALPSAIRKITSRSFDLKVLGTGGSLKIADRPVEQMPINQRRDIVQEFVLRNIDNSRYYIIFDALDEDYNVIYQPNRRDNYFNLLRGLFKAAQNVRHFFARSSRSDLKAIPLVFLRDEIFDLCRDNDKNKWLDRSLELSWSAPKLQNLIAFRLSRSISHDGSAMPFNTVWRKFFRSTEVRGNRRRREHVFNRLLRETHLRPRDIINYVRECADVALNLGEDRITNEMIPEAAIEQSKYMRREIIDEIHPVLDDISEILDLFTGLGKQILTQSEFKSEYNSMSQKGSHNLDSATVLKTLFHFNVIGSIGPGNRQFFRYNSNQKVLRIDSNICVHRGLLRVLDL